MLKRSIPVLLAFLAALVCSGAFVAAALAETSAPGWEVLTSVTPTNLPPGGEGIVKVMPYNVGAAASSNMVVVDTLPKGVTALASGVHEEGVNCTGGTVVTCLVTPIISPTTGESSLGPGKEFGPHGEGIQIPVKIAPGAEEGVGINRVTVSGGGAASAASRTTSVRISSKPSTVGFENFDAWFSNADGTSDTQAGSHPYEFTIVFTLNKTVTLKPGTTELLGGTDEEVAGGDAKDVNANLPPGVIGDPRAVPECTAEEFEKAEGGNPDCPASTQVGLDYTSTGGINEIFALYNMVPPSGVASQLAFKFEGINVYFDSGVRSGGNYGITVHANEIPQRQITFNSVTIWGVPDEASHDFLRSGGGCNLGNDCPISTGEPATPFLTLPTVCNGPMTFTAELLGTYQDEATTASASSVSQDANGNPIGMTGCDLLGQFNPGISLAPDTSDADTPAGLTAEVNVPEEDQEGLLEPGQLESADLKNTTVTLPRGVAINPGQATGLVACPPSDEALGTEGPGTEDPATCPVASKVGEDELETPLLANRLKGSVYILQPNPPNLQLLVTASGDGVNLKLVGDVHLNESTGQLTTTFTETPELPFTHFKLSFSGGARAALITPPTCGLYSSEADFTPWNTPFAPDFSGFSSFAIDSAPGGAPCQNPLPFTPSMTAGATTDQAGGYTSFTLLLTRADGQQRIEKLQFKTPEGLLGMIAGVPLCQEPQAAKGECSAASQIGHTIATAGAGPYPFEVPQVGGPPAPIYLTGPYDGAPFGLSIVVPVVAGPFNLGTVVVRAKIEVDPHTSQLTITTTEFPTILDGIPADIRAIDAVIDRPNFMFNPTDCSPMSFSGTATSTEGATAALASHFQVGSCQALKFQPNFKVSTNGKTSRANGASLTAKIAYPTGNLGFNQASSQSNINTVKVDLPKQLPSRLTTLQQACPAAVFNANPANCPPNSIVGHARALTPVLPVPIEGPAYFVSHAGEEFPNLVVVFQGDNVTIDLVGDTFISKAGITSSTFKQVPDVPIGLFELSLPEGKYSALAANVNLCEQKLVMPTHFVGQNGAEIRQNTPIEVEGCSSALSISSHSIKKTTATVSVYVPAAGTVKVSGSGLPTKSGKTKGREILTFKLTQKKAGRLTTKASVAFTPSAGKKQSRSVSLKFKK